MIKLLTQKDNQNFLRLWFAQLISQFGDRIHQLALVGFVVERAGGSAMSLAMVMTFSILPVFIIQPFAGVFVDRWDRRVTLLICDIARGLLVLLIPFVFFFWESMIPVYIIVFLSFSFSRFYTPAKMSIIPDLVSKDKLLMANSLVSTTGMIAFVLGCALGGFLVDYFGARNGFIIDGITFFVSGLFVFSIDVSRQLKAHKSKIIERSKEIVGPIRKSVWAEIREGFQYLFEHKELRFVINMIFTILAAAGAVYVVIIVFIQESFESVTKDLGVLAVCLGVGLFLGAIAYGKWGKKFLWYKVMFFCLITGGVMLSIFALMVQAYPNLFMAMGLAFLLGLMIGPIFITANTVIHLVSSEEMRGKVFSAMEIVIHLAFLTAMLVSSWLSESVGVPKVWILVGVGVIFAFIGLNGFLKKERFDKLGG